MAKPGKLPDFRKMYPEASDAVIAVLRETERKMQYQEYDLKAEQTIIDHERQTIAVIPSREDSLERILEQEGQFQSEESIEELAIYHEEIRQLHKAVFALPKEDRYLIWQLYFQERTERELAAELGVSQKAVNKKRHKILAKLKKYLTDF